MNSQYVKVIAFFILAVVWFYSLGIFSYWVVYRHIRTKSAWNTVQLIQAIVLLIGFCFAALAGHGIEQINSIPADERSDDVSGVFLGSFVLPQIALFPTMKFIFPKIWKGYWEIRKSLSEKTK
jgi:uncharacterized oligopeptide transporter (OPT) family protein